MYSYPIFQELGAFERTKRKRKKRNLTKDAYLFHNLGRFDFNMEAYYYYILLAYLPNPAEIQGSH
jgi:hypothetical protein